MDSYLLWLHGCLLASVRLAFGLTMTPLFTAFGIPATVRLILTLAFAGLAAAQLPSLLATQLPTSFAQMLPALGSEVAVGLLIAVGIQTAFATFAVAGRLMDVQMGFSLGAVLDPVSKGHATVVSSGLNVLAMALFFLSNAHQLLLAGLFRTFEVLPIGRPVVIEGWWPMAQMAGAMFSSGFAIAAPVVVALLLSDVVVAVTSRNLPQMNVLFLSIPLKVLLGLVVLVVAIRLTGPVLQQVLLLPLTMLDRVH